MKFNLIFKFRPKSNKFSSLKIPKFCTRWPDTKETMTYDGDRVPVNTDAVRFFLFFTANLRFWSRFVNFFKQNHKFVFQQVMRHNATGALFGSDVIPYENMFGVELKKIVTIKIALTICFFVQNSSKFDLKFHNFDLGSNATPITTIPRTRRTILCPSVRVQ